MLEDFDLKPGERVVYLGEPVFDLIIKTGETGIVEQVQDDSVFADWPRCGIQAVPRSSVDRAEAPPERDELVREIVRLGGSGPLSSDPINIEVLDYQKLSESDSQQLVTMLRELRDRLRREAIERGWDVE